MPTLLTQRIGQLRQHLSQHLALAPLLKAPMHRLGTPRLRWWKARLGAPPCVALSDGVAVDEAMHALADESGTR
jgi:hypothetical protein